MDTAPSLERLYVGASGWSYPTWKPGFYPAGMDQRDFLAHYAEHFRTVELNTTGYRLPSEEQFRRWRELTPPGFRFTPKLPFYRPQQLGTFQERVRLLGDRLGPVRVLVQQARDDGMLELVLGSFDPELQLAFDFRHPSWDGVEARLAEAGAVRVDDLTSDAPFRYLRLRDPPYSDNDLAACALTIRSLLDRDVYVYFRHEDAPTAPAYARRLVDAVGE